MLRTKIWWKKILFKTKIWWKRKIVLYGYRKIQKTNDIYEDIAENIGTRFDTLNYELYVPLPKQKMVLLMKDELGWIITKIVGLKAKAHGYLKDDGSEDTKGKGQKNVCHQKKP